MRQAILLDNGDLDAMKRGGGLQLEVAPGLTVTLLYAPPRMGRPSPVNGNGNHHAAAAVDLPRRVTAPASATGRDRNGRAWVMTPARKRAIRALKAARMRPATEKKRLAGLRAAFARKRKAKEEAANATAK